MICNDKPALEKQYGRFIDQVRVEVEQTFWLYNFFFVADSALLGTVYFQHHKGWSLLVVILVGLVFSMYWKHIMDWKNKWRNYWLKRIEEVEEKLQICKEYKMWQDPKETGIKRGLWRFLFLLPQSFIIIWAVMLLLHLVALRLIHPYY